MILGKHIFKCRACGRHFADMPELDDGLAWHSSPDCGASFFAAEEDIVGPYPIAEAQADSPACR